MLVHIPGQNPMNAAIYHYATVSDPSPRRPRLKIRREHADASDASGDTYTSFKHFLADVSSRDRALRLGGAPPAAQLWRIMTSWLGNPLYWE
jgi:hypothetical protein